MKIQGDLTDTSKDWLVAVDRDGTIKGYALLFKCSKFKYWWLVLDFLPELYSSEVSVNLFEKIIEIAHNQEYKNIKFSMNKKYFSNSPLELRFNEIDLKPIQYEFWMELTDFSLIPQYEKPIGINFQKYNELKDYTDYVDILNDAFSKAFDFEIFTAEDYQSIANINWKKFDVDYWFAEENKKPIGFCTIMTRPPIQDKGVIMTLAIYHTHHRKGIGRCLLGLGIKSLIEKGCKVIELGVEGENPNALTLYKKFGFKEIKSQTKIDFIYSP